MSINIIEVLNSQAARKSGPDYDSVRLGPNQIPLVLFTPDGDEVRLHYCDEQEISTYVRCADGKNALTRKCLLCLIGKAVDERYLLPAYLPAEERIGILPVSKNMRP